MTTPFFFVSFQPVIIIGLGGGGYTIPSSSIHYTVLYYILVYTSVLVFHTLHYPVHTCGTVLDLYDVDVD